MSDRSYGLRLVSTRVVNPRGRHVHRCVVVRCDPAEHDGPLAPAHPRRAATQDWPPGDAGARSVWQRAPLDRERGSDSHDLPGLARRLAGWLFSATCELLGLASATVPRGGSRGTIRPTIISHTNVKPEPANGPQVDPGRARLHVVIGGRYHDDGRIPMLGEDSDAS